MFEKIKELVGRLDNNLNLKNYKNGVYVRNILQNVKNEAQRLRKEVVEIRKSKNEELPKAGNPDEVLDELKQEIEYSEED